MMLYYLFRRYAQTKFHSNLIGSSVDLTWNDPIGKMFVLKTQRDTRVTPASAHRPQWWGQGEETTLS